MNVRTVKRHLAPYSILQRRRTTIHHAFASAVAPVDVFDEDRVAAAMRALGQDPNDLKCVYCDLPAETWDHLVGLVKGSELRGYGHQIGNLVPCCKACNSRKGAKDWKQYLRERSTEAESPSQRERRISAFLTGYAVEVDLSRVGEVLPDDWARFAGIKQEILRLMGEADVIAGRLRAAVVSK